MSLFKRSKDDDSVQQQEQIAELSFEALYDEYFDKINRYLRYRVHNHWDADDLTTTVFLKAFEKIDQYEHYHSFGSWIFRIAHNTYIDYLRKKKEYPMGESQDFLDDKWDDSYQPEIQAISNEGIRELQHLLDTLPEDQRNVLILRYFGELRIAEVAEVLNKTESAVKMLAFRGIQRLRKTVGEGETNE